MLNKSTVSITLLLLYCIKIIIHPNNSNDTYIKYIFLYCRYKNLKNFVHTAQNPFSSIMMCSPAVKSAVRLLLGLGWGGGRGLDKEPGFRIKYSPIHNKDQVKGTVPRLKVTFNEVPFFDKTFFHDFGHVFTILVVQVHQEAINMGKWLRFRIKNILQINTAPHFWTYALCATALFFQPSVLRRRAKLFCCHLGRTTHFCSSTSSIFCNNVHEGETVYFKI